MKLYGKNVCYFVFYDYNNGMENLNEIIANNIILFRKKLGLTQLELAEKLNYSDKAVSKWERAEGVPDIFVLKQLADIFGIKVDTLLIKHDFTKVRISKNISISKKIIMMLAAVLVWLVATIAFVALHLCNVSGSWFAFVVAVPVSFIVLLVLNCLWGKRWAVFTLISLIIWSVLITIYIGIYKLQLVVLFLIGVPLQIATILWWILDAIQIKNKQHN